MNSELLQELDMLEKEKEISKDILYAEIEEALKAGKCIYENNSVSSGDELFYDMIPMYSYHYDLEYEGDDMAALLIGLGIAENEKPVEAGQIMIADQADLQQ